METDIIDTSVYLIWWVVHPAKLLEVLFNECLDLLKSLSVAQPFPFNQLIKEGLRETRQKALDYKLHPQYTLECTIFVFIRM